MDINWPFPETTSSPVWRAARERERQEAENNERKPQPSIASADPLASLLGDVTAERLQRAGLLTLGDVARAHQQGRRWWAFAPGIGETKARAIAARVLAALPAEELSDREGKTLPAFPSSDT